MKYCEHCGAQIPESAKFCSQCGSELGESVVPENEPQEEAVKKNQQKKEVKEPEIEELDLTTLDKQVKEPTKAENIINIQDILETDEKVEVDNTIKREVLKDDELFSKICPMCGEDMQINIKLLENKPVKVKCLKCGNETTIW
jgi:predicted RNA-binding Zn-ribbon protein involved in translation (DUF1610 family)